MAILCLSSGHFMQTSLSSKLGRQKYINVLVQITQLKQQPEISPKSPTSFFCIHACIHIPNTFLQHSQKQNGKNQLPR